MRRAGWWWSINQGCCSSSNQGNHKSLLFVFHKMLYFKQSWTPAPKSNYLVVDTTELWPVNWVFPPGYCKYIIQSGHGLKFNFLRGDQLDISAVRRGFVNCDELPLVSPPAPVEPLPSSPPHYPIPQCCEQIFLNNRITIFCVENVCASVVTLIFSS